MRDKRGRGRPPAHPDPTRTIKNDLNNNSYNNYLSLSENLVDDDGGGDGRGKRKNNNQRCGCWLCLDVTHIIKDSTSSSNKKTGI